MTKHCKKCHREFDCMEKKCPLCGTKLTDRYTEEELAEIQKQNDDMMFINTSIINTLLM